MSAEPTPTLVAMMRLPDGAIQLQTADGRVYVCRSAQELWSDAAAAMASGRALPPGQTRTHRVRGEVIEDGAEDKATHATFPDLNRAQLEQGISDLSDVFEEACAQEWGSFGRMGAQLIRKHAPRVAHAVSPRSRKRRGRSKP